MGDAGRNLRPVKIAPAAARMQHPRDAGQQFSIGGGWPTRWGRQQLREPLSEERQSVRGQDITREDRDHGRRPRGEESPPIDSVDGF